jgi:TPR repeat protein
MHGLVALAVLQGPVSPLHAASTAEAKSHASGSILGAQQVFGLSLTLASSSDASPGMAGLEGLTMSDLLKAADGGDMKAHLVVAYRYLDGKGGVEKNPLLAMRHLRIAAEGGQVAAMTRLAFIYDAGEGVEKDRKKALKYFLKAATAGDEAACHRLGMIYLEGDGAIKDYETAVKWFKVSADAGSILTKKQLALMYQQGLGVTLDLAQSFKLYLEAAMSGDRESQLIIAAKYNSGLGVTKDPVESYAWYNICAANGDDKSASARETIAKDLDFNQKRQAQKRSRELLAEIEAKKVQK